MRQVSSDMEKLTKEGINSFKFFLAYKGAMAVTDQQLLSGLRRSKELGALPMVRPDCSKASAQPVGTGGPIPAALHSESTPFLLWVHDIHSDELGLQA